MTSPAVAAVVPARNEERRVGATVRALRAIPAVEEVVVVDDVSADATAEEARAAGARVLRPARRLRKGGALALGAASTRAPVLLFADADLGGTAGATSVLVDAVLRDGADLAIARIPNGGGPSGFGMVESAARWGIRRLTGARMERPLSGQRALRREVLDRVGGLAPGFGVEAALTVDALRAGFRVVEVPCDVQHARTGRDLRGFLHRARQGLDLIASLLPRVAGAKRRSA